MWNDVRRELLQPVSSIGVPRIFNALVAERIILVGQIYMTSQEFLLEIPKFGASSVTAVNCYLNERGLAAVPTEATAVHIAKDFSVAAAKIPHLRLSHLRRDMDRFLLSSDYKDIKNGFSRFMGANKQHFLEMVGLS